MNTATTPMQPMEPPERTLPGDFEAFLKKLMGMNEQAQQTYARLATLGDRLYGSVPEVGTDPSMENPEGFVDQMEQALRLLNQWLTRIDGAAQRLSP
jgi:hypothetical protein